MLKALIALGERQEEKYPRNGSPKRKQGEEALPSLALRAPVARGRLFLPLAFTHLAISGQHSALLTMRSNGAATDSVAGADGF